MSYCTNAACPAQVQQRIEHFVSRAGMDIRGIGESLSTTLYDAGLVKNVADLYDLTSEQLLTMERMAEKSADNIISSISNSKNRPLSRVIFALGILHVGEETAELLASHFGSIDKLAGASREELLSIPSVGSKLADSITAFFGQAENKKIIQRLKKTGVRLEEEAPELNRLPLAGMEFVFTGRLETLSRPEAEAKVKTLGGSAGSSVTRKTAYLVVGADPGSKLARAQALGTRQLTEEDFIRLLGKVSQKWT